MSKLCTLTPLMRSRKSQCRTLHMLRHRGLKKRSHCHKNCILAGRLWGNTGLESTARIVTLLSWEQNVQPHMAYIALTWTLSPCCISLLRRCYNKACLPAPGLSPRYTWRRRLGLRKVRTGLGRNFCNPWNHQLPRIGLFHKRRIHSLQRFLRIFRQDICGIVRPRLR